MKLSNLKVEYVEVRKLKYCEYNARTWTEKATKDLTESIKRFGIVSPLLVNSSIVYEVPADAKGLKLKVGDLSLLGTGEGLIDLGL